MRREGRSEIGRRDLNRRERKREVSRMRKRKGEHRG